jgi:hypothetical protein
VKEQSLIDLLQSAFNQDELRVFLRESDETADIEDGIAWDRPDAVVVSDVVTSLTRRGVIDEAFFGALVDERPGRKKEIEAVRREWLGAAAAKPKVEASKRSALAPTDVVPLSVKTRLPFAPSAVYETLRDRLPEVHHRMSNIDAIEALYSRKQSPGVCSGFLWRMNFTRHPIVGKVVTAIAPEWGQVLMTSYQHGIWDDTALKVYWNYENPFYSARGIHHVDAHEAGTLFRIEGELAVYVHRGVSDQGLQRIFAMVYRGIKRQIVNLVTNNLGELAVGVGDHLSLQGKSEAPVATP